MKKNTDLTQSISEHSHAVSVEIDRLSQHMQQKRAARAARHAILCRSALAVKTGTTNGEQSHLHESME